MKKIKCRLILHGSCREMSWGVYDSISDARKYVRECGWSRPYTIIKLNK